MIKLLMKILRNSIARIFFVIITSLLFIGAGLLFLTNEMVQNKVYYLNNYREEQEDLTIALSTQVQILLEKNSTDAQVKQHLQQSSVNSSYRWCFFSKDSILLQAKDANSMAMLEKAKIDTLNELKVWLEQKGQIVTTKEFTFQGSVYCVGIMSDESNVILEGKTSKHSIYVMMAVGLLCMVFFATIVLCASYMNILDRRLRRVQGELAEKIRLLEEMSEEIVMGDSYEEQEVAATDENAINVYEEDIVYALLRKTNSEEFFPFSIVYIKMEMGNRYYKRDDLRHIMDQMRKILAPNFIMAEVYKGEYVFLLYRSSLRQVKQFKEKLKEYLKQELPKHQLKGIIDVRTADAMGDDRDTALRMYEMLQKKMIRKRE